MQCGTVDVRWNGSRVASVDLYAPSTHGGSVIALTTFATPQTGTLAIVATTGGRQVTIAGVAAVGTGTG